MGSIINKVQSKLKLQVHVGDVVAYLNKTYSVVFVDHANGQVVLFDKYSSELSCITKSTENLFAEYLIGAVSVTPGDHYIVIPNDNNPIFLKRLAVLNDIIDAYGPTYLDLVGKNSKPELKDIIHKHNISGVLAWKIIHLFLKNGCDRTALYPKTTKDRNLDPNKTYARRGAKAKDADLQSEVVAQNNPEILSIFNEYKEKILSKHFFGPTAAYEDMMCKYFLQTFYSRDEAGVLYLDVKLLPPALIPTFFQFYSWYKKNTTYRERETAKIGVLAYKNERRLQYGDTFSCTHGAGHFFESDHWEVPVYLISQFSNDTVSKAILSVMIDVYTGHPVAINLSFDNNSNRAFTSMVLSLGRSKMELCKEYGVHLESESDWPSQYLPRSMRIDSGSDFTSINTARFCKENDIVPVPVTPGCGSYKPNVERFFGALNTYLASLLEDDGYITGMPNSHPEKKAHLTIKQLFKIILEFTVAYIKTPRLNFKRTEDMRRKNIGTTPLDLFQYSIERYGAPTPIINKNQFLWSLLMDDVTSTISSNHALHIKEWDLEYADIKNKELSDMMEAAGENGKPFPVRYDPRNIANVYYLKDGVPTPVHLKPAYRSYADTTLYEYLKKREKENTKKRHDRRKRLEQKVAARYHGKQTISLSRSAHKFKPGTKFMRNNTIFEKEATAKIHTIADELENENTTTLCIEAPASTIIAESKPLPKVEASHTLNQSASQRMIALRKNMDSAT